MSMFVGFTCSTFDLLHSGHILMLQEAREQCDFLLVGLQTDPTIDRPEKNKPVQSITERWIQLDAVRWVDQIIPYATEYDLEQILKAYTIGIRFVGEEYEGKDFTGKDLVPVYYNKRKHAWSSSALRARVENESI